MQALDWPLRDSALPTILLLNLWDLATVARPIFLPSLWDLDMAATFLLSP
jgi:hypothetical protein